jgi:hypothetical protein
VSLRCLFGHHDWEGLPREQGCLISRVCLRCRQREVFTSIGGGWGGWQEVGEWTRADHIRRERRDRAKKIAADASGAV